MKEEMELLSKGLFEEELKLKQQIIDELEPKVREQTSLLAGTFYVVVKLTFLVQGTELLNLREKNTQLITADHLHKSSVHFLFLLTAVLFSFSRY
jgi:hypothetical protein